MKIYDLILIIGIFLIVLGIVFGMAWKLDEIRCYNMPLNDFYNDNLCVRHTQTYEEMNNR